MKLIFLMVALELVLSGCACMTLDTAFGLDGKAVSWCERKYHATKLCKKHGGLKDYHFEAATCNNGHKFTKEVERY